MLITFQIAHILFLTQALRVLLCFSFKIKCVEFLFNVSCLLMQKLPSVLLVSVRTGHDAAGAAGVHREPGSGALLDEGHPEEAEGQ